VRRSTWTGRSGRSKRGKSPVEHNEAGGQTTMKIDFLESGADDCPLIRIYGNEPEVCQRFREAFERLANRGASEVSLTDLPGVEPLGSCCLVAQPGRRDRGVVRKEGNAFCWVLTPAAWDNVAGLIEPFCNSQSDGYQWLDQAPASEARVLVSTSPVGCW